MNKKESWWQRLKRRWENLSDADKVCLISTTTAAVSGVAAGIYIGATVTNKQWQRDFDDLTISASNEAIRAYDQGVFDGATNPMLLRNLKDLGRI